ncbi:hypothetical protein [Phaffia rhodozyma]|uniref:Uncharacterized protein n=1 Tax=Phaffia rhodozyma TaxID=264483 RepID=A0A0F7SGK5_PHARH|nr:hypothetical protein [Phaffia rhodozyma]
MHLVSILASFSLVSFTALAQNPSFKQPSGGFDGTAGGDCTVEWVAGNWTIVSGCDNMPRFLAAVRTNFDASSTTSITYDCPNVDTSSTIYFYRMTDINSTITPIYTERFCIKANSSATCGTPAHSTQPSGTGDAWGTGYIQNSRLSLYNQEGNSAFDD